jgi:hypothetical protein
MVIVVGASSIDKRLRKLQGTVPRITSLHNNTERKYHEVLGKTGSIPSGLGSDRE